MARARTVAALSTSAAFIALVNLAACGNDDPSARGLSADAGFDGGVATLDAATPDGSADAFAPSNVTIARQILGSELVPPVDELDEDLFPPGDKLPKDLEAPTPWP